MSKSWIEQSRNSPPLVGMYAACGGAWSWVFARTVWTNPISPSRTAAPRAGTQVEAALETYVHGDVGAGRDLREVQGLVQGRRDRLLAEGRDAGLEPLAQERRMARGGRRDDEPVDSRGEQLGRGGGKPDAQPVGHLSRGLGVEVGDDDLVDHVESWSVSRGRRRRTDADETDTHTRSLWAGVWLVCGRTGQRRPVASDRGSAADKSQANVRTLLCVINLLTWTQELGHALDAGIGADSIRLTPTVHRPEQCSSAGLITARILTNRRGDDLASPSAAASDLNTA